jgi:hypothetical protein
MRRENIVDVHLAAGYASDIERVRNMPSDRMRERPPPSRATGIMSSGCKSTILSEALRQHHKVGVKNAYQWHREMIELATPAYR